MSAPEDTARLRDMRAGGWFHNENELIDVYAPRIGPNGIAVYNILSRHASAEDTAFPKIGYMAECLGVSQSTIKRALRLLLTEGMIVKVPRFNGAGRQLANDYQLVSLKDAGVTGDRGEGVTDERVGGSPVNGSGGHSRTPAQEDSLQEDKDKKNSVRGAVAPDAPAEVKPIPTGKYIISGLMDKIAEAKNNGKSIYSPTDREKESVGSMAKVAIEKDGYEIDTCLIALDYMVAKAAGDIEGEPAAWCSFRTALGRVDDGWQPGQSNTASVRERRYYDRGEKPIDEEVQGFMREMGYVD